MEKGRHFGWADVKVMLNGVELKGVESVSYNILSKEQLQAQLNKALEVENYELCAKLRDLINNYNN